MKDVTAVEAIGGYRLRLTFDDGQCRDVDIATMVEFDGVFAPLRDPEYFRQVKVNADIGTIVWPNGADICPDALYEAATRADAPHDQAAA